MTTKRNLKYGSKPARISKRPKLSADFIEDSDENDVDDSWVGRRPATKSEHDNDMFEADPDPKSPYTPTAWPHIPSNGQTVSNPPKSLDVNRVRMMFAKKRYRENHRLDANSTTPSSLSPSQPLQLSGGISTRDFARQYGSRDQTSSPTIAASGLPKHSSRQLTNTKPGNSATSKGSSSGGGRLLTPASPARPIVNLGSSMLGKPRNSPATSLYGRPGSNAIKSPMQPLKEETPPTLKVLIARTYPTEQPFKRPAQPSPINNTNVSRSPSTNQPPTPLSTPTTALAINKTSKSCKNQNTRGQTAIKRQDSPQRLLQNRTPTTSGSSHPWTPIEAAEPYFEYPIFQKTWSNRQTETDVSEIELTSRPGPNVDEANAQAKILFQHSLELYKRFLQIKEHSASIEHDEQDCVIFSCSFSPVEIISTTYYVKVWVRRDLVSAYANRTPQSFANTSFVSKTVYVLRLFRLVQSPNDYTELNNRDSTNTSRSKPQHRVYHPLPSTECYTSLDAANRAAFKVQIDLSHKKNPREAATHLREMDLRALREKLNDLTLAVDSREGDGYWRSTFRGYGAEANEFELVVEKASLCGPRNL